MNKQRLLWVMIVLFLCACAAAEYAHAAYAWLQRLGLL